jgi:hypothetical protein
MGIRRKTTGGQMNDLASPLSFESVLSCPLCGTADSRVVFDQVEDCFSLVAGEFRYVRCNECELVYQTPRPVTADLAKSYQCYRGNVSGCVNEEKAV